MGRRRHRPHDRPMLPDKTSQYVNVVAKKFRLPPPLVRAIVTVESGSNRFAMRVEPGYPYLWCVRQNAPLPVSRDTACQRNPPKYFAHPRHSSRLTEWIGQQTSWGSMQVMGAVARELGFEDPFPALCDPLIGLTYGCHHLKNLRARFLRSHGWPGVAAAYNAGSPRRNSDGDFENQDYVNKIAQCGGFQSL